MLNPDRFIADRARAIDASGIRRVFDLAAQLSNPINLSIGQPDFDVPEPVKEAAIEAIRRGFNRYTPTQGIRQLQEKITARIIQEFPHWKPAQHPDDADGFATLITSGVSGGLLLAILVCVQPGDDVLIPDPYFVMYRHLVVLAGGRPVFVDTYPDFQLTAERLERARTPQTKILLFSSPSNPTGVVTHPQTLAQIAHWARQHNILVIADEIYDEFCYEKVLSPASTTPRCPSLASYSSDILLLRGFSKTWAMTGWRLGWAAGPRPIIDQMTKLQQYSFVCAPSMVQVAGLTALDTDMSSFVEVYRRKRDRVVERLRPYYDLTPPGGAFYAFPKVPEHLGLTATQFVERAIQRSLLIIPGSVFSQRDTHFRLSYACDDATLERGLDMLVDLARR